jgi:hypothetical protein
MESSNRGFTASVRVQGKPVKEVFYEKHDTTYIEGRKGTEYSLHFKNKENKRVLIIPSVDGLCTVDGNPAGRKSAGFIIEPFGEVDITGWTVDDSTAAAFTFWPQDAKGDATYVEERAKVDDKVDTGNQGMIGFMVLEEHFTPTLKLDGNFTTADNNIWGQAGFDTNNYGNNAFLGITASTTGHTTMMHDSSSMNANASLSDISAMHIAGIVHEPEEESMGTKFGEAVEFNTTVGTFNRGRTVGTFVFEYDTLKGMKAKGVPLYLFKEPKPVERRSAFPADNLGCTPPAGWGK